MYKVTGTAISGFFRLVFALMLLIFLPHWSINYWQGWAYLFSFSIPVLFITLYFLKTDKGLIERRTKAGPSAEKEKIQVVIQSIASVAVIGLVIVSVLDHKLQWSVVPDYICILSNVFTAGSFYLIYKVFKENSFTSAIIIVEEGQKLISTGLYSFVRHPMYLGAIILIVFTPLSLGSVFGLFFSFVLIIVIAFRAIHEEKYLLINLPGYKVYYEKVKYRLIPYFW